MTPELVQLGPFLVFVGILINVAWGIVQRRWLEADRRATAAALEAERAAHAVARDAHLDEQAAEIKAALDAQAARLLDGLDANTELTRQAATRADEAFVAANDANAKIAQTNEQVAVALRARSTRQAVTNADTNERVRDIQKGLHP